METSRIVDGHYYSGSPHNKLMSRPAILFDKDEFIKPAIDRLGIDLAERLMYEYGEYIDWEKLSVVNTLVRQEKIRPDILQFLYAKEREIVRELIK